MEQIEAISAGEVVLDDVVLIANIIGSSSAGTTEIDLVRSFAEINLFEDIFSNSLYGNILISDSNNLLDQLSIQGLEGIRIRFRTPGLSDKQTIYKTFGIYAISDQQVIMNDRLQSYRLHFASLEFLNDAMSRPLNRSMPTSADGIGESGDEIVSFVFSKYVTKASGNHIGRNIGLDENGNMIKDEPSKLIMGFPAYDFSEYSTGKYENVLEDETGSFKGSCKMRFIVPNWSPLKTISHATNKSIPSNKNHAGTFLFYESNKAFHYVSIDELIEHGKKDGGQIFKYKYDPANLSTDPGAQGYTRNVVREYSRVLNFDVQKNFNLLDNQNMGFFGAQIRSIDMVLKRYREHNYSAEDDYDNHSHTSDKVIGMFPHAPTKLFGDEKAKIDPRANVLYRYREPYFLFDKDTETPLVTQPNWTPQRMARMSSLSNYSLQISVHGRTDIKVGDTIYFEFPGLNSVDKTDKYFNGFFLVTAIRHVVTPLKHMMTLEIVKEGLQQEPDKPYKTAPDIPYFDVA